MAGSTTISYLMDEGKKKKSALTEGDVVHKPKENSGLKQVTPPPTPQPKSLSTDWYQDIKDFHKIVMNDSFLDYPNIPNDKLKKLRKSLIEEEINETLNAIDNDDIVGIADGITDSIVVLLGTAITYGIDLRPIWNEIHRTNMAKKDGPLREDGKKLKPEGWKPPNIKKILKNLSNLHK